MFAPLYHAHHTLHSEDLPFWHALASQQGSPILELGCGTGRVFLPLYQQGFEIVGLDNNPAMLVYLKSLAGGAPVSVFQADMSAFHLAQTFALTILPCNTFSSLTFEQRRGTLACARRHLQAGGLLAISMPNPDLLAQLPQRSALETEDVFPHPGDGEPVEAASAWRRGKKQITFTWQYDHFLADGRTERLATQVTHTLQPIDAYCAEIEAAGLHIVDQYGDYDRSRHNVDSPYLIFTMATRQPLPARD
ncbi:MAG: class I SAM-dependent methyltransferase [Chloroflexota bacterium]